MPRPHPPEFRRRAVELANRGPMVKPPPVARTAEDLGIRESACGAGWLRPTSTPAPAGLSSDEREELAELRAATGCWRWKTRSSSGPRPTSPGRTSSQNDLHLHRAGLPGPARGGVLSGDEGVDLRVLRLAGPAGVDRGTWTTPT